MWLGLCQYSYQIKAAFHHFKLVQAATQMHRGTRFYHGHNFLIAQLLQIFKYVYFSFTTAKIGLHNE